MIRDEYENINKFFRKAQGTLYESIQPVPTKPKPTPEDYNRGWFTRYFLKRVVPEPNLPFEIDQRQYELWESRISGIDQSVYEGISIKWRLTGSLEKRFNQLGYPVEYGVKETNQKLVENAEDKLTGINRVLTNATEYYQS